MKKRLLITMFTCGAMLFGCENNKVIESIFFKVGEYTTIEEKSENDWQNELNNKEWFTPDFVVSTDEEITVTMNLKISCKEFKNYFNEQYNEGYDIVDELFQFVSISKGNECVKFNIYDSLGDEFAIIENGEIVKLLGLPFGK